MRKKAVEHPICSAWVFDVIIEAAINRMNLGIGIIQSGTWRAFITGFCTLALLAVVSCKSSPKKEGPTSALKPVNVVFITLDTVRADHLHCYGDKNIQTPTIDGLAARGVLFEKAVAQAPLTLPSHASMFTGTNPNVSGVRDTGGFVLKSSSIVLAKILEEHGWDTAAFVSAYVFKRVFGFNQGFSVDDDRMPGGTKGEDTTRPANITVDHALAWLKTQSTQPFFVWLHFYDAHEPYVPPPPQFHKQFSKDPYDAEIAFVDQQLGRFLDAVKKKSPPGKTMIVLLSDHGEGLGDHGEYQHGIFLYDSTLRIAWIMSGPGIPAGVRIRQQARTIDVLPTILDLLGGNALSVVQGTSMVPAFSGKKVASTYSYEETLYPKFNMRWAALRGIHTADWMYVRAPKPELYDLDKDPGELNNVIDAHPRKYRELENQLKLLTHLGPNGKESIVYNQMDQQTMERLRSLGYIGGTAAQNTSIDDSGPDPKDQVEILKLLHLAWDPPVGALPDSQRIKLIKEALAKDPANPSIYYDLGDLYQRTGQFDLELQLCQDALHHGVKSGTIYSCLGWVYLRKGDMRQAISNYEQVAQFNPTDVAAETSLAMAYAINGQMADAEREYRRVLAIQQYVPAYDGLGLLEMKQHDFASARQNLERAIQLDPDYAEGQLNLGALCMQTGDVPCARTAFIAFLAKASQVQYKDMIARVHNALNTVLAQRQ